MFQQTEIVAIELPALVVLRVLAISVQALLTKLVVFASQLLILQHLIGAIDAHKIGMGIRVILEHTQLFIRN